MNADPPCLIFEDDHVLVVNKPAGINTHGPSPWAGEGIYEWLKNRESRWSGLSIIHRLDKETSGVMVFGKTPLANRSLTRQFAGRTVEKKYVLLTDRPVGFSELRVESALVRTGAKYVNRPLHAGADRAETIFRVIAKSEERRQILAEPVTGRTHQIRAHAAAHHFPILGDTLYGGTPAPRIHLHACELVFDHPRSGETMQFNVEDDFPVDPRLALRHRLIDVAGTNCYRLVHGDADGWPGWCVDRLGDFLLSQSDRALSSRQIEYLKELLRQLPAKGVYHKTSKRHLDGTATVDASPEFALGSSASDELVIRENGARFSLRFTEGCSVGLFLDQRDNRRRLLTGHVAPQFQLFSEMPGEKTISRPEVLNTFAYTCGFSVCAAMTGARVTSVDLSRKYLEWGKRNFALNQIDPALHEFLQGDVFHWLHRLQKRNRRFDTVILDPPTFSRSKVHGPFRADKDYPELAAEAAALVRRGGVLFAASNAVGLGPERFLEMLKRGIAGARRSILQQHYQPQPPDFPITRSEPAYLKTVWLRLD